MKKIFSALILLSSTFLFAELAPISKTGFMTVQTTVKQASVVDTSMESMQLVQMLTKDYLYSGMGTSSNPLDREMKESIISLGLLMKEFDSYTSKNRKVQRQLKMILLAESDLESIVSQKYSLENTQLLLDLGSVISEATTGILEAVGEGTSIYKKGSNARMLRLSSL